jgi:hypothetical protein
VGADVRAPHVGWRLRVAIGAAVLAVAVFPGEAHKPITSPFTFNEDVFPIVREHCGSCHVRGGSAPMSLLTHGDAVPWGESLKLELIAGHMPPWQIDGGTGFRNVHALTGRELNVLLTWAAGGTPVGSPEKAPPPVIHERRWPLGTPDLVLEAPTPYSMPAGTQDATHEITLATGLTQERWLRAVDLLPEAAPAVRSAAITVRRPSTGAAGREDVLALWVAGDRPIALDGAGLHLPAGAELAVRIHYRKTWEYEQMAITDRSAIGLYFAAGANPLQRVALTPRYTIADPIDALAVYPDPQLSGVRARVTAVRPDGTREELIAFRPRADWARRYWFREPVLLPRGTVLETAITPGDASLLPPGVTPLPAATGGLVLNYVTRQ